MTDSDENLPTSRRVAFVVYDGFELLDLAGASAVFSAVNSETGTAHYDIDVISVEGGPVKCSAGFATSTRTLSEVALSGRDTLFVVGGDRGALELAVQDQRLQTFLADHVSVVGRFGSFCMGSFILARAGLLSGRNAATHWAAGALAENFDAEPLNPDALYIKDHNVWTSAGLSTGIDMALAMVEEDLGRSVMGKAAQYLVVDAHRSGSQPQFSPLLSAQISSGDHFPEIVAWIEVNLHLSVKVADMAEQANMSERNFYRKFSERLGVTPSKYLEQRRVERARHLLRSGMQVKAVVSAVGFGSESGFRTAYRARFGVSPATDRPNH